MSVAEIQRRIGVAEMALKDAGPDQAINAIIDALKEIAKTLDEQQNPSKNPSTENPSPKTPAVSMMPEDRPRRLNFDSPS
jgi:hypothetical protein